MKETFADGFQPTHINNLSLMPMISLWQFIDIKISLVYIHIIVVTEIFLSLLYSKMRNVI